MAEEQESLAYLTGSTDSVDAIPDLKPEDVELVNQIVRRAQHEPLDNDRDRLDAAYRAVFEEHSLETKRNNACVLLLDEILKPGLAGTTLYEKFETVMRMRGVELVPDDESTRDTTPPPNGDVFQRDQHAKGVSKTYTISQPSLPVSPTGTTQQAENQVVILAELDYILDNPPADVAQRMREAQLYDKRALYHQFLIQCRDQMPVRNLQLMEQKADWIYKQNFGFKVLTHWYNVQREIVEKTAKAETFCREHYKSRTVGKLLDVARVHRMQAMEDERLKGMGLYKMTIARRENAVCQALDTKLKYKSLLHMINSSRDFHSKSQDLNTRLAQAQQRSCVRTLGSALAVMINRSQETYYMAAKADEHRDSMDKSKLLRKWYAQTEELIHKEATGEQIWARFLLSKYLARLREQRFRRKALCRRFFAKWRQRMQVKEEERAAQKKQQLETIRRTYRREYKIRLATRCLRDLKTRTRELTQLEQKADEVFKATSNKASRRVAHKGIIEWYHQSHNAKSFYVKAIIHADEVTLKRTLGAMREEQQRVIHLENKADGFDELLVQSASVRILKTMGRKAFELRRRRQDADDFRDRHNKVMARGYLDSWHRKAAENRGEGLLVLPPATPAQRRADQLNRLASTTPLVAPRTSFAARLRGDSRAVRDIEEDDDDEIQ